MDKGVRPKSPGEVLRETVLESLKKLRSEGFSDEESLQALYPNTILDADVLETVTSALLSGNNFLIIGPPGSGKTTLAKDVWRLYPKETLAVETCPVQDDPFSLVDESFSNFAPPCPYCKTRYGGVSLAELGEFDPKAVKPDDVPVKRLHLREGYGFARVQGSPEVFPDNLTGSINLSKLEEIGDPTSPLVLEPGKLLQANRGVLLIDEIGKLPRGTQNVLLQALQERIVTPAKSRETFPASFIAVTTSNLDDLDNISEPLNDRLVNLGVPFNKTHAKNLRIVEMALAATNSVRMPWVYREASVHLIEEWRKTSQGLPELYEVGSNRSMIDVLRRAESFALLGGSSSLRLEDFGRGIREAMRGRIRARGADSLEESRAIVDQFVEKTWRRGLERACVTHWCLFFEGELKKDRAEADRVLREVRSVVAMESDKQAEALREHSPETRYRRFAEHVARVENVDRPELPAHVASTLALFDELKVFDAEPKKA